MGFKNLSDIGKRTNLSTLVRPRKYTPARQASELPIKAAEALWDDWRRGWPEKVIAKAMQALIGAVYYDGGFLAARRAMVGLDLIIKPPGRQ